MDIGSYLRACLVCGRSFGRIETLCRTCEDFSNGLEPGVHLLSGGITVKYLFPWSRQTSRFLSSLTISLKGNQKRLALVRLAKEFVWKHRLVSSQIPEKTIFISSPPRIKERTHAQILAGEFSKLLNVPAANPLAHQSRVGPQKLLNGQSRRRIRFNCDPEFSSLGPIIFVDDVVTTGSTARAALQAMKSSKNFQVWALSCRIH